MRAPWRTLSLYCALGSAGVFLSMSAARAETPYEMDQREQMEHYQSQHALSPQVQQTQRWEQEWRQQHPNEPVPNLGILEKMHRGEIIDNMNRGFAQMRQQRQATLQQNYALSKQHQQQMLAAQHITWTPQQWQEWDRQYDAGQRAQAQAYLEGLKQAGEIEEAQRRQREIEYNLNPGEQ